MNEINWKMLIAPLVILFIFIGGIIGIVNWQKSKQGPEVGISVNLPEGQVQTSDNSITVSGKAQKGDKVSVNGRKTKVAGDGSFSQTVTLNQGDNKITVRDQRNGKDIQTVEREVNYTPAAPAQSPVPTPQAGSQAAQTQSSGGQPSAQLQTQTPSNLSTSGPADMILPVVGFGGIIIAISYYLKSKKKLALSLRK